MTEPNVNPAVTPAKKRSPLVWILGGCGVILLLCGLTAATIMWWGYHKAKTYLDADSNRVTQLWSDVPKMDAMSSTDQIDMPMGLKAVAKTMMDTMMRGLNDGKDAGHWDWTAFSLPGKLPADVQAFYTSEKMQGLGWKPEGGCSEMQDAVFCAFQKQEGSKSTGLLVIVANDKEHNAASVFFIRQEGLTDSKT